MTLVLIQALMIRARAYEGQGNIKLSIHDLESAYRIDRTNSTINKLILKLQSNGVESLSKKNTMSSGSSSESFQEKLTHQIQKIDKVCLSSKNTSYLNPQNTGKLLSKSIMEKGHHSLHPVSPSHIRLDKISSLENFDGLLMSTKKKAPIKQEPENKLKVLAIQFLSLLKKNRGL